MPLPPYKTRSTIPALVIVLGLAASLFTYSVVRNAENAAEEQRFKERARLAAERLSDVIAHESDILSRLRDLYSWSAPPDDSVLLALTASLFDGQERDPALAFIGWAVPVEPVDVGAFELGMRASCPTEAGFTVHDPDGRPSVATAAQTSDGYRHWVLKQVAPSLKGGHLKGLDLAADASGHETIREALLDGELAASSPLPLVDATSASGDTAVLLVLPVFTRGDEPQTTDEREQKVTGVLVAALAIRPLLERAFPIVEDSPELPANVRVLENDKEIGHTGPEAAPDAPLATRSLRLANSKAIWWVEMRATEPLHRSAVEWLDRTSVVLPPSIFVVMCLVSWIVWTQQRQTDVVGVQVQRQTAELRRKNLALETKEQELEEANRKLLELSNTDALTGILNRRAFEVQIDKERERSRRTDSPFGLLIFDIDHFKDYNDRYGHAAGDEVLRRVAHLMHNEARRIDSVARYGGEEFVILTAGIDAAGLMTLGERVRQRIQQANLENATSPAGVITVSGGGALSSAEGASDPRAIFDLADRCLYQAKSTGRNRVVMVM